MKQPTRDSVRKIAKEIARETGCGLAALSFVMGVGAQELTGAPANCPDLPDINDCVIVGGMRLETVPVAGIAPINKGDETASVTVLSAAQLAIRQSPNIADQLRAVPGVAVSRSGGVGALTQVRMRGAEANHTLILLDGIEVSDPVNGETDFGLLTAIGATRVEVLRGEGSAIHGSDAIGGVVSLRTVRTADALASGFVEIGTDDTYRGTFALNGETVGASYGAAIGGFSTGGVDTSGLDGEKDGSDALSGLVQGRFDLGRDWALSGLALVRQSKADIDSDTDFDGLLNDVDRETEADQWLVGASLTGQTGALQHALRASMNEVARENYADGTLSDEATGQRMKLSYRPSYRFGTAVRHHLTGLIDYEVEDYDRSDVQFGGFTDASESFETVGVAGEYRAEIDALDLSASVRHDSNDGRFKDATTWRIGAAYAFTGIDGRVRASAGAGVKNPTFTELFGFFPGSFIGNADLTPEQSTSWELGWDQRFGDVTYSATYFSAELEDEIFTAFNPDFTSTAQNRDGASERSGIELSAHWTISEAATLSGQVTQLQSENEAGEDEIRVPATTASLALSYTVAGSGARIGAALDYVGEQDDFNFGAFPAQRVTLDSYVLASVTADYPLSDRVALTLRGENLLDEAATDVFGYAGLGAGVFIGLRLR